jgi:hypothetical protein
MEVHLMIDMMSGVENAEDSKSKTGLDGLDDQLVEQLVSRARAGGLKLTGEGGVLQQLTKRLRDGRGAAGPFHGGDSDTKAWERSQLAAIVAASLPSCRSIFLL